MLQLITTLGLIGNEYTFKSIQSIGVKTFENGLIDLRLTVVTCDNQIEFRQFACETFNINEVGAFQAFIGFQICVLKVLQKRTYTLPFTRLPERS